MLFPFVRLLAALASVGSALAFAFTATSCTVGRSTGTSRSTARQSTFDMDGPIPEGRVQNITQWLTWSDQSLQRVSDDGKGGMYDRINSLLLSEQSSSSGQYTSITTPQQIHESTRFVVLSHGNQTDPIYNYENAAGFRVFRWPAERYYKLPSRYSAPEGANRQAREAMIDSTVAQDVIYIDEAVRVRYPNATVTLRDAILWNVYDDDGNRVGQTALFDEILCSYSDLDR